MKKYPCIESTVEFTVNSFRIRVWRNEDEVKEYYDNQDIVKYIYAMPALSSKSEIAERIAQLERVNAVQVISTTTRDNGIMIYTVPF